MSEEPSLVTRIKTMLHQPGMADELGEIARSRIEQVGRVQRILGHAIELFAARGDDERISPENRHLASPWLKQAGRTGGHSLL